MGAERKKYALFSKTQEEEFETAQMFNPQNPGIQTRLFRKPGGEVVKAIAVSEGISEDNLLSEFPQYKEYEDTLITNITGAVEITLSDIRKS